MQHPTKDDAQAAKSQRSKDAIPVVAFLPADSNADASALTIAMLLLIVLCLVYRAQTRSFPQRKIFRPPSNNAAKKPYQSLNS